MFCEDSAGGYLSMFKKEMITRAINVLMEMQRRIYVRAIVTEEVMVPASAIIDGFTTMNVTAGAVQQFKFEDKHIEFSATFSGRPYTCVIPYAAIAMVYCPDDHALGVSMPIEFVVPEDNLTSHAHTQKNTSGKTTSPEKKSSHLKVIK